MFLLQFGLFWFLPTLTSVPIITIVSFIILMCYGGGFGTMPAFAADYFGSKNVGPIYGLMLTAWGTASYFGPQLLVKMLAGGSDYTSGLHIVAWIVLISTLLPILISPPKAKAS
jgi:OFA family oxalate/formate antiporter-like MFS transporter